MISKAKILAVLIFCFINFSSIFSQDDTKLFRDSLDGAFDISKWLFDLHGFVPIISPITEPAVGFGLIGAGVFFIPKKDVPKGEFRMPDIVGAAVGKTQNGTFFGGAGYAGFWKDDHIRYRGIIGYGDIKLKYYGSGNDYLAKNPANFSIESSFLLQQALFRIKNTHFLLGGNYTYAKTIVTASEGIEIPGVNPLDLDLINSSISLIGEYESFNNILSPTKGIRVNLNYSQSFEVLGSDRNNARFSFFAIDYIPINKKWISGFRVESMAATENTPFYMLPFISLRGVPALRYQGELTILAETEQFVKVYKRWSMVGFTGIGTTVPSLNDMNTGATAWNVGGGFRYLVARMLNLQMGMDIARGPENWAFYIVFGNAWLK